MALHIGIGNFSGAIASNVFRAQDEPRYILGRACSLRFFFRSLARSFGPLIGVR